MPTIDASRLEALRRARALSQRALADAAGITRQSVSAIESGRMQPSVGIAIGIARALGTTVEELFAPPSRPEQTAKRAATATICGRLVTHALEDDLLAIEPSEAAVPNVFIAGCDLSVGLLSRHASAGVARARVLWLNMTNRAALAALERNKVHAAVIHGQAAHERVQTDDRFVRFELATTQAGWLFARGNPLRLRGPGDFKRAKARIVNRPAGAGARRLLDDQLRHAGVDSRRLPGYDRVAAGQMDAGRAIAQGFADAAVGMGSVARVLGLEFFALREERCVLIVARATVRTTEIRVLLDSLRSPAYGRDLEALDSYDIRRIGERIA